MAKYRLLITDVTSYGELRCVAGWDLDREKMVRPEPHPGGFWPSSRVKPAGVLALGKSAEFEAAKPSPRTDYPHLTEDRVVAGAITASEALSETAIKRIVQESAYKSLEELFEGHLIVDGSKGYVPAGTECRSLGGLQISSKGTVIESYTNFQGKHRLRIRFRDAVGQLAPNLTSTRSHEIYAKGQLDFFNKRISAAKQLVLRIGLARTFPNVPNRCYLQVNGLRLID